MKTNNKGKDKIILQEFNEKFRNTDWYSDNWRPIESFLLSKLREAREEVIEEIKKYLKGKKGITPQAKDNLREFLNELKEKV